MKSLYNTIVESDKIDGHIHLFDHSGIINKSLIDTSKRCVCFADIAFRYLDKYNNKEIIKYYDNFIKQYYNPEKHILLATGITSDEIINIYKKYPQFIKGFGELKCYSKWKEGKLPYGNLKWIKPLLEFNKKIKLPVYIHYNLNSKQAMLKFEELLSEYNMFPVILCHAGMVEDFDNLQIHNFVRYLLNKYTNLYIDVSTCKTREFYIENPGKLLELKPYNIIIGTDINPIVNDVIKNPINFCNTCYNQVNKLHTYGNFTTAINNVFKLTDTKADKLINMYRQNFNTFNRHCKIHLLTRGNLIGMFSPNKIRFELKENAKTLSSILNMFNENNIDSILNEYVLIGYDSDDRKKNIGKLFKSADDNYKKFLCIVTILEMTYTFKRVNLLNLININAIHDIIVNNIDLIKNCINNDKYSFKEKASTKYINSLFFIKNLNSVFDELKDIVTDNKLKDVINYFLQLYHKKPDTTTIYGLTHILIGASDFYTKELSNLYTPILHAIEESIYNNRIFNSVTLDLQMELLLCNKLFNNVNNINMDKYITFNDLEKNEHTNMLYILIKKYNLND